MEFSNLCHPFLIIYSVLVYGSNCENFYQCGPGLKTDGVTVPKGDIKIEYGNPVEIYCLLNPSKTLNYTSSSLFFLHNGQPVSKEFVEIVNSTAIRFYVKNLQPSASTYYCKSKTNGVENKETVICFNKVIVGYKPKPVSNFSCESFNWKDLTCTWVPENHYIPTSYTLSYSANQKSKVMYKCPQENVSNRCYWSARTNPLYRQSLSFFFLKMKIMNSLGNHTDVYRINNYANVVPDKPVNLTLIEATTNSLTIQWYLSDDLLVFPPGVVHKVEYQSQWEQKNFWHIVNDSEIETFKTKMDENQERRAFKLNITNLKYSHALHDIRVFMRSRVGVVPYKWSKPATITLRTKETVPGKSPRTDIGSYESVRGNQNELRDIFIYWQQIPKKMENGDNFEYKVISVKENGHEINVKPHNVTKTYAKFKGLSYSNYTFKVVSSNNAGYSDSPSEIFVPSISDSPPGPVMFTKIAYDGVYGLIWKAPINASNIESYTLFWCDNKKDRPYECIGYLNWIRVPSYETSRNITIPDEDTWYQFAISANTQTTSSGMFWASCVLPGDKEAYANGGKIKSPLIQTIGPRSFELQWRLECLDQGGIVKQFDIHYCPIMSPIEATCKETIQKIRVDSKPDENLFEHAYLTGLKPYTTYAVNISIVTMNSPGHESKPIYATLTEAAPDTPPRSISVTNVTSTSVTLTWLPPDPQNGVIRDYKVYLGNGSIKTVENTSMVTLYGLESDTEYNVSMSACTVECSNTSTPLSFKTKMGPPGVMQAPAIVLPSEHLKKVNITWVPPSKPSGPLNYYEIKFSKTEGSNKYDEMMVKSTDSFVELESSGCTRPGQSLVFKASVRAVNVDSDNVTYPGHWSIYGSGNCMHSEEPRFGVKTIIILCVIGVILLIVVFYLIFTFIKWLWFWCKAMQNVEIKLPPNLSGNVSSYDKEKDNEYHLAMHVWNPHLQDSAIKDMPSPDQQFLLKKEKEDLLDSSVEEGEELAENRESSGCGSGHGSVSSSINGAAHISSDSGTEADQRASSPDVFSDSPNQRCLLRQRVVSSNGSGVGGEGYCRVAPGPVGGLGYVTMPSTNPSRGYVMHPPFWTTTDPPPKGYVIAAPPPSHIAPTTYCQVGWKPSDTHKPNHDCGFPGQSAINGDRITDSDGDSQLIGPVNPTSSI